MYVVLAGMIIVESLVLGALWGTYCEQASAITKLWHELELSREECKALMEAIARGSRTPIQFDKKPAALEPSEGYYDRQPELKAINGIAR